MTAIKLSILFKFAYLECYWGCWWVL